MAFFNNFFFPKIVPFRRCEKKFGRNRKATGDNSTRDMLYLA